MAERKKAIVNATGEEIEVVEREDRDTFLDYWDCQTEYAPGQITIIETS